ncbi:hypothetical protein LCGC14_1177380 [marine sediment metagenome]|uniref:Uncharacterized protein n=1 Tax=marine sediment metagenome TaxID=412755 RepID=A0A0F9LT03_9ZZZZ
MGGPPADPFKVTIRQLAELDSAKLVEMKQRRALVEASIQEAQDTLRCLDRCLEVYRASKREGN